MTPPLTPEPVLTTAQVAAMFRVNNGTVARWVRRGRLRPAFRTPGGHARYRESDIRALLEGSAE